MRLIPVMKSILKDVLLDCILKDGKAKIYRQTNKLFSFLVQTLANISQRLPVIVAQVLNRVKSAVPEKTNETNVEESATNSTSLLVQRLRRRSTEADPAPDRYSDDGVGLVKVNPVEKNRRLRVATVAVDRGNGNGAQTTRIAGLFSALPLFGLSVTTRNSLQRLVFCLW